MALAITLHLLSVVIWVGGMFFAYMALRPAAGSLLEPPVRQTLWVAVFNRFFVWVWISIITLLISGFWMIFAELGGMANNFYRERVSQHLRVGLETMRILREQGVDRLHSRKLRGFDEPAFR